MYLKGFRSRAGMVDTIRTALKQKLAGTVLNRSPLEQCLNRSPLEQCSNRSPLEQCSNRSPLKQCSPFGPPQWYITDHKLRVGGVGRWGGRWLTERYVQLDFRFFLSNQSRKPATRGMASQPLGTFKRTDFRTGFYQGPGKTVFCQVPVITPF